MQEKPYLVEEWRSCCPCSEDVAALDEILRISNDQGVATVVVDIKVEVVNDGRALVVGLESMLGRNLAQNVAGL